MEYFPNLLFEAHSAVADSMACSCLWAIWSKDVTEEEIQKIEVWNSRNNLKIEFIERK